MPAGGKVPVNQRTSVVRISADAIQLLFVNYAHPAMISAGILLRRSVLSGLNHLMFVTDVGRNINVR